MSDASAQAFVVCFVLGLAAGYGAGFWNAKKRR